MLNTLSILSMPQATQVAYLAAKFRRERSLTRVRVRYGSDRYEARLPDVRSFLSETLAMERGTLALGRLVVNEVVRQHALSTSRKHAAECNHNYDSISINASRGENRDTHRLRLQKLVEKWPTLYVAQSADYCNDNQRYISGYSTALYASLGIICRSGPRTFFCARETGGGYLVVRAKNSTPSDPYHVIGRLIASGRSVAIERTPYGAIAYLDNKKVRVIDIIAAGCQAPVLHAESRQ